MNDAAELFYEDLSPGQVFRGSARTVLDAEAIKAFGRAYDPQPFHVDEAAAAGTVFGGLAASGWHTAAVTMRMLVDSGPRIAGGIVGAGMEELRWPRPTRPGDTLRAESEVVAMRPSRSRPQQGLVSMRTTTLNQHDEPVQVLVATLVVPRRTPG